MRWLSVACFITTLGCGQAPPPPAQPLSIETDDDRNLGWKIEAIERPPNLPESAEKTRREEAPQPRKVLVEESKGR